MPAHLDASALTVKPHGLLNTPTTSFHPSHINLPIPRSCNPVNPGQPIQNDEEFKAPGKSKVKSLLQKYPNTPPKPAAIFGVHSSSNGFDFSRNSAFGYEGEAFVAQFGDMAGAGKVLYPVGFKVVRVNVETGVVRDFAVNKGKRNGPASWLKKGGLERPVAAKFNRSGSSLYVVDFGIMRTTKKDGVQPQSATGMIWKITKQ